MDPIQYLGHTVKDEITDLTGVATAILYFDSGTVQIQIQPRGDGSKFPDAICVDKETIILLPEEKSYPVIEVESPTDYLGKKVKEVISGTKGVAIKRTVFMNGCEYYHMRHIQLDKDGGMISTFLPSNHIQLIEDKPVTPAPKKTGGPSTPASIR